MAPLLLLLLFRLLASSLSGPHPSRLEPTRAGYLLAQAVPRPSASPAPCKLRHEPQVLVQLPPPTFGPLRLRHARHARYVRCARQQPATERVDHACDERIPECLRRSDLVRGREKLFEAYAVAEDSNKRSR